MKELPQEFYISIGIVVACNLGVIITMLGAIFKAGKFVAATEHGIADAKDCGVRAHKRIDDLKGEICKT